MSANEFDTPLFFPLHVADFAKFFEGFPLFVVVPGADPTRTPVKSIPGVADVDLQSCVVPEGDELAEDLIVADEPRAHDDDHGERTRSQRHRPAIHERPRGQHDGIRQRRQAPKQPDSNPARKMTRLLDVQRPQKKHAEQRG